MTTIETETRWNEAGGAIVPESVVVRVIDEACPGPSAPVGSATKNEDRRESITGEEGGPAQAGAALRLSPLTVDEPLTFRVFGPKWICARHSLTRAEQEEIGWALRLLADDLVP